MGEVVQLETTDIALATDTHTKQPMYIIRIRAEITKTNNERVFTISRDTRADYFNLVQKYSKIRSKNSAAMNRLFLNYKKGRLFSQPIGNLPLFLIFSIIQVKFKNIKNKHQQKSVHHQFV